MSTTATHQTRPYHGRTRVTALSLVDSIETRDMIISSGMETGVVEGYENLDALLARST